MDRGSDSFLVLGLIKAPPRAIAAGVDARCAGCGRKKLQAVTDRSSSHAYASRSVAEAFLAEFERVRDLLIEN
jgi:hypothetical protein